jgi:hypothetical protein
MNIRGRWKSARTPFIFVDSNLYSSVPSYIHRLRILLNIFWIIFVSIGTDECTSVSYSAWLPLLHVVLSAHFPWGFVCTTRVTCEQSGVRHLCRAVSHRGTVIKMPGAWVLSGIKAYKFLPCGGVVPKRMWEPNLRAKLTCGVLWRSHPGTIFITIKHKGVRRTRSLA